MNYKEKQLNKLKIDNKSPYLPSIKVVFGINETHWLNITYQQYEQIKEILTKLSYEV